MSVPDYNRSFMLPASFQTPAALLLLVGGLISCLAGYLVFRVVLVIYGFILGALLAISAMGTEHTLWMVLAAWRCICEGEAAQDREQCRQSGCEPQRAAARNFNARNGHGPRILAAGARPSNPRAGR